MKKVLALGKSLSSMACLVPAITARAVSAQQMIILAEGVPVGLNYNCLSPAFLQGLIALLAPQVSDSGGEVEDGVTIPDFTAFEERLAES